MVRDVRPAEALSRGGFLNAPLLFVMVSRPHQYSRPSRRPRRWPPPHHSVFALLWLDSRSTSVLRAVLQEAGLHPESLESSFHLTVYHARRFIPGLRPVRRTVSIECDLAEIRTMVLVPGGENPRQGVIPSQHSLALRLTTRNVAVPEIQALRAEFAQLETDDVLGARAGSTRRRNAFGARHYQPHLKICGPRNGAPQNLTKFGKHLRASLDVVRFSFYEVRTSPPVGSSNSR